MTAREQFSWVWLVTLLLTYAGYFVAVAVLREGPPPPIATQLALFAAVAILQVVIVAFASIIIHLRKDPEDRADERDRAISHRAASVAYHVMMGGLILVGCVMPFYERGWDLFNAAVFFIALSEAIRLSLIVLAYRRGLGA